MRILYLIPARKGSKGLPGKNIKVLVEKPLIQYSIEFALANMNRLDELCISTNDPDVIKIANSIGVEIPFLRPDNLSNDTATSNEVIMHAITFYESKNQNFDAVLLLQPTSPIRIQDDFIQLVNEYDENTDMVVSVKIAKENPYFTLFEEDNGFLQKSKLGNFSRRQDCPNVYALNGSMYLINIESLKRCRISEFNKIKKIVMPEERSVDIDNSADWALAEFYMKQ